MIYCQRCGGETAERVSDGRPRPVCVACGSVTYFDPKLAVGVLIARDGKVLLGKRGAGTREPGKWAFPAGFVERGEEVESAAAREAREEAGLEITVGPLLALISAVGETVVLAVYAADGVEGEAVAGDDLEAVGWFAPDALPEMAFPHDAQVLMQWRQGGGAERAKVGRSVDRRKIDPTG